MNPVQFARAMKLAEDVEALECPWTDCERALARALILCYRELQAERERPPVVGGPV